MARGQFWDGVNLANAAFRDISQNAAFWDDDNFTFRDILYPDILFNDGTYDGGIWEEYWMGRDIAIDGEGRVTAGTLTGYVFWFQDTGETEWFYSIYIESFEISAAAFFEAQVSDSTADDQAVIRQMLAGNDSVILSAFSDSFYGGKGNDTLLGESGADQLFGQAGNDSLVGSFGYDELNGGGGSDTLSGGAGNDILSGGARNDTLDGGIGLDTLDGGTGADTFLFGARSGEDTIVGWEDGIDRLLIMSGADDFADLTITSEAGNAMVAFGNVRIVLAGIDATTLDAGDFSFG